MILSQCWVHLPITFLFLEETLFHEVTPVKPLSQIWVDLAQNRDCFLSIPSETLVGPSHMSRQAGFWNRPLPCPGQACKVVSLYLGWVTPQYPYSSCHVLYNPLAPTPWSREYPHPLAAQDTPPTWAPLINSPCNDGAVSLFLWSLHLGNFT